MSQAKVLYDLQQIDDQLRAGKQRLSEVLRAQKESDALSNARRRDATAAAKLQQWQTRHTDLRLELGSVNEKAKRSEERLYSGNVKNPKELNDLQREIEALGRRRATLEDDVLEALIMVEESELEKTAAAESLAAIESDWQAKQSDLKREQNELALRLSQMMARRERQAHLADARLLAEYDSLAKKKNGSAVAGLMHNTCLGCRLTIPAHKVKDAHEGKLVYCDNCGRILNFLG
jgi:predicted  nucleic acid-binding Zn-ribbon protein